MSNYRGLENVITDSLKHNPNQPGRKDALDYFRAETKDDPRYLYDLQTYYFEREHRRYDVEVIGKSKTVVRVKQQKPRSTPAERSKKRADDERIVKEMADAVRHVVCLDQILPNGKHARHCTVAEWGKAGGFWTEAEHQARLKGAKGSEAGDKYVNEPELQNLRERFFGSPRRPARAA